MTIKLINMKITIQHPGAKVTRKITGYLKRHLDTLDKLYSPNIEEAQVSLRTVNDSTEKNSSCEIKLIIRGNDLYASSHAETFQLAMQETIDALKHQVERLRTKRDKQRTASIDIAGVAISLNCYSPLKNE